MTEEFQIIISQHSYSRKSLATAESSGKTRKYYKNYS